MEFLFKTSAALVGATAWFEVYRQDDNSFYCKQITWNAYQFNGYGDFIVCMQSRKWKKLSDKYIPDFLFQSLCESLTEFYRRTKVPEYTPNKAPEN